MMNTDGLVSIIQTMAAVKGHKHAKRVCAIVRSAGMTVALEAAVDRLVQVDGEHAELHKMVQSNLRGMMHDVAGAICLDLPDDEVEVITADVSGILKHMKGLIK